MHLIFEFAENVLLSSIVRQPGQLYLTYGGKFDVFGVSSPNLDTNFILGYQRDTRLSTRPATRLRECSTTSLTFISADRFIRVQGES